MIELFFAVITIIAAGIGIVVAIRSSVREGRFWRDAKTVTILISGVLIVLAIVLAVPHWITLTALVGLVLFVGISLVRSK
jgi:hypothetical protein